MINETLRKTPDGKGLDAAMTRDEPVPLVPEAAVRDEVLYLFGRVARRLADILPDADIQHVGSTAIPGSLTKGDLDVQVRVAPAIYRTARETLFRLYKINEGGFVADDATSFEDHSTVPPHGVHLTVIGGSCDIQWRFRDALIASHEFKQQYNRLKESFHTRPMRLYRDAKERFVLRVQESEIYRELTSPQ